MPSAGNTPHPSATAGFDDDEQDEIMQDPTAEEDEAETGYQSPGEERVGIADLEALEHRFEPDSNVDDQELQVTGTC